MSDTDASGGAKSARRSRRRPAAKKKAATAEKAEAKVEEPKADAKKADKKEKKSSAKSVEGTPVATSGRGASLTSERVPARAVTQFMRQLIMLLEAGTPLLKALRTLSERSGKASLRRLVADIADYVENGNAFWQSLERHPRVFTVVEVNLIRASEASGTLLVILEQLATYRERRAMLRKKVRGALLYPVILVAFCFAVALFISMVVIPEFEELYEKLEVEIHWFSEAILNGANWFATYWWTIPAGIFAVFVLIWLFQASSPVNRMRWHRIVLAIPIMGRIVRKYSIVQMTRTLGLLLKSGLSMMVTLDLTRAAISNLAIAQSLQSVRDSVESGGGMEAPLRRYHRIIDPVVTDMLVTGEESGRLDQICDQIAKNYEEEVDIEVTTLGEALQPLLVILIGGVVGVLFAALFLPMIQALESLNNAS